MKETTPVPIASQAPSVTPTPITPASPATSSEKRDFFGEAVNKAMSAATITQSAKSKDDWNLVVSQWQEAIALMKAVPASSPNYTVARNKAVEYQSNLDYAKQRAAVSQAQTKPTPSLQQSASSPTSGRSSAEEVIGRNYSKLQNLLAAGKWEEADKETRAVMQKVANREQAGWLTDEDFEKFPCTDLRTIDQLWRKYSDGRFGFSVQKQIWLSVGGNPSVEYGIEAEEQLADHVGWRLNGNWLTYKDRIWNLQAPVGHLPLAEENPGGYSSAVPPLLSRAAECQM